jgi:hypothetical protein
MNSRALNRAHRYKKNYNYYDSLSILLGVILKAKGLLSDDFFLISGQRLIICSTICKKLNPVDGGLKKKTPVRHGKWDFCFYLFLRI